MHDDSPLVEMRVERFVRERLVPALHRRRHPLTVTRWEAPGEPVPFAAASAQAFTPFEIGPAGTPYGKPWGTTWFRLTGEVPAGFGDDPGVRVEVDVDLGYLAIQPGFQCEATAYRPDGTVVKGLHPRNRYLPLAQVTTDAATTSKTTTTTASAVSVDVLLEASSNPDASGAEGGHDWYFQPTAVGSKETAGTDPVYRMRAADVVELDLDVYELTRDVWTLRGLLAQLPQATSRRASVLRALEDMVDAVDPEDVSGTAAAGRAALASALAAQADATAHRTVAVGHAHIDSAWLWPTRETARKCTRTFSNVLSLMEEDDDFTFACSSAQQYAWVRDAQPELFERIKKRVAEGRFVAVGGMWVESDTNLPGGEALARQFVAGKRFFAEELGVEPLDVWLPDSFGYTAAMPQIARLAGARWFLTQKPSWNETNRIPHHTFWWEGIDGSRIYTHFPPADNYNSEVSAEDLARAERQYAEKGRANTSLLLFGYGDGGGGPTREMVAATKRARSLEGSPRVELGDPHQFFRDAEAEYPQPPVWSGEMYLEFHRGTYTSQARTKRGNRRSEHLLREAELWATAAAVKSAEQGGTGAGYAYPYDELERIWHTVLLQQFHDILPGTSIAWVHREAEANYARIAVELESLIAEALAFLAGDGESVIAFNAAPHERAGAPALGMAPLSDRDHGKSATSGGQLSMITAGGIVLDNGLVRVVIDADGLLASVRDLTAEGGRAAGGGREVLPPGTRGGLLTLHRDTPTQWDAWDVDVHYQRHTTELTAAESVELVEDGSVAGSGAGTGAGARAAVRVVRSFGSSRVEQLITLEPGSSVVGFELDVDWHEKQKMLKLAFPVDVHADRAASEIQFGHVMRATHTNTSWDAARFETCAHRWVHVGEAGYGAAVVNDSTYGYDIGRATREDGGTTTTVRMSLLRAPVYPDPQADQGEHRLRAGLVVGAGIAEAVREGYRANLPVREVTGSAEAASAAPVVSVQALAGLVSGHEGVVVEAVKLAEDRSGDVIVRLYESLGGRASARVVAGFAHAGVTEVDLLERPVEAPRSLVESAEGQDADVHLRPFQIVTLRFSRSAR
ncbi:alpha-mannosidase [Quadrisphaera granulorum]|uniref:Alpha-mannosidase n=1 Tax=Quadrisphaera granulorum TaxID=317664 RepID=A0A316A547_9ACTN|nr:glycoside hydrolase family 38 C-terminal domain-containing protein [Quadrisphaera granulorum]PWJ52815.1 alpha-mannosidase [Quadrisphaera granulorum]SZE97420.1 alpha-mannosidase [Quadrisphaera granulorum]